MIETVAVSSQPMLYITTQTSDRPSSIASTIKLSLDQVLRFMDEQGIGPDGKPLAIFSDWNGRLVTIEAGYPVSQDSLTLAGGRVQAGRTPDGPAARTTYSLSASDYVHQHDAFAAQLRAAGLLLTGTTWEIYTNDPMGGVGVTELFAQLLPQPRRPPPVGS